MEISQTLADRLIRWVHADDYRPSKPKRIAADLKLDPDDYRELRRAIKQLVLEGRLAYGGNHLVFPASASGGGDRDVIRGTFRRAMGGGGFGFIRPGDGGTDSDADIPDDLFVPPGNTGGALEGDLVEARMIRGRGGRTEAKVTEVRQRARRQFTGTFRRVEGEPLVFLDGTPHDHPVAVGDVRGLPLEDDDKVFVELVRFPDDEGHHGEGVILERLGSSRNPAIDTLLIIRQYGLPDAFGDEVIDEARRRADAFDDDVIPAGRRDLTEMPTITIDPIDARDFDDAISLQRESGRWRLWVHIADVSHFVPVGSRLDEEARRRGTSVYLPDRVIPMLPEIISNHLASLQPDRQRLAKTVEIEILDDLTVTHAEVHNSVIRSDRRLSYEQVDRFLADPPAHREPWGETVCDLLAEMHALAMKLRKRRFRHGALSLNLPEVKLDLDKSGKVKGASTVENTESHQIIEEFMLAANEAVASWLDGLDLDFLRRIHPSPDRRKLRQLSHFLRDLGITDGSVESRFEIQAALDQVSETPLEQAVHFAVLKSMSKAVYAPNRDGHYALDIEHYCHFTSPIRRYPDLTVHRLVQRLLDGHRTPDESFPTLVQLGHHCSDMERNAAQAERELIELKLLYFLKKKIGETMDAVISRVFADGLHARCLKLPVDGFIPVDSLPKDSYRFERRGQMVIGFREGNRFRLGDRLTVRIARVDLQERELFLEAIRNHTARQDLGKAKKRPAAASKAKGDSRIKRKYVRREQRKRRKR